MNLLDENTSIYVQIRLVFLCNVIINFTWHVKLQNNNNKNYKLFFLGIKIQKIGNT